MEKKEEERQQSLYSQALHGETTALLLEGIRGGAGYRGYHVGGGEVRSA